MDEDYMEMEKSVVDLHILCLNSSSRDPHFLIEHYYDITSVHFIPQKHFISSKIYICIFYALQTYH